MGRNPATGEAIHIKASKKVAFRAAKELKEADLSADGSVSLTPRHSGRIAARLLRNGACSAIAS